MGKYNLSPLVGFLQFLWFVSTPVYLKNSQISTLRGIPVPLSNNNHIHKQGHPVSSKPRHLPPEIYVAENTKGSCGA